MILKFRISRRWLAVGLLGVSAVMLVVGLTVLDSQLSASDFVSYWMVCLIFTTLAAWVALLDVREIREKSRKAQRQLIEETLQELEQARTKTRIEDRG